MRMSPSCRCCGEVTCRLFTTGGSPFQNIGNWTVASGTWTIDGGAGGGLRGTDGTAYRVEEVYSGAQHLSIRVMAQVASQVASITIGGDNVGVPSLSDPNYVIRLTFGDSTIPQDCGLVELLYDGTVLNQADVIGLVEGVDVYLDICIDEQVDKFVVSLSKASPTNPLAEFNTITAIAPAGASGILAFTASGGSDYILFRAIGPGEDAWQNLFRTGDEECEECGACGTLIDAFGINDFDVWQVDPAPDDQTTCEFTVTGPYKPVGNLDGYASVSSNIPLSAYDRLRGYGLLAEAVTTITQLLTTELNLSFDNDHYIAQLIVSPMYFVGFQEKVDITLNLYKDAALLDTLAYTENTAPDGTTYVMSITAWFCGESVHARFRSPVMGALPQYLEDVNTQVGDGSAHSAYFGSGDGGVFRMFTMRCLYCDQCDNCDETQSGRQWQVEIAATPSTFDGTYILSPLIDWEDHDNQTLDENDTDNLNTDNRCRYFYEDVDVRVELVLFRSRLYLVVGEPLSPTSEGSTNFSPLACSSIVDEEIDITGGINGIATVNSL